MKLYYRMFLMHLRSQMEYKASFFMMSIGIMITSLGDLLAISFLMMRFHTVKGFTLPQILLCYSVMVLSYTFAELIGRGFDHFQQVLKNGDFDRIMLRPVRIMPQVFLARMNLERISKAVLAGVVLIYAMSRSGVVWAMDRILVLILMILGGTLMFTGLFILHAVVCFFTLEGLEVMNILTDGSRSYGEYPVSIYGKEMLKFYTYVIPVALIQYYPLLYILGRTGDFRFGLLPLFGALFLVPCFFLWKFGVRRYKSNGS